MGVTKYFILFQLARIKVGEITSRVSKYFKKSKKELSSGVRENFLLFQLAQIRGGVLAKLNIRKILRNNYTLIIRRYRE